jgi:hypothetical protein
MQPFIRFTNYKFSIDFGYYADQLGLHRASISHIQRNIHMYAGGRIT